MTHRELRDGPVHSVGGDDAGSSSSDDDEEDSSRDVAVPEPTPRAPSPAPVVKPPVDESMPPLEKIEEVDEEDEEPEEDTKKRKVCVSSKQVKLVLRCLCIARTRIEGRELVQAAVEAC